MDLDAVVALTITTTEAIAKLDTLIAALTAAAIIVPEFEGLAKTAQRLREDLDQQLWKLEQIRSSFN